MGEFGKLVVTFVYKHKCNSVLKASLFPLYINSILTEFINLHIDPKLQDSTS